MRRLSISLVSVVSNRNSRILRITKQGVRPRTLLVLAIDARVSMQRREVSPILPTDAGLVVVHNQSRLCLRAVSGFSVVSNRETKFTNHRAGRTPPGILLVLAIDAIVRPPTERYAAADGVTNSHCRCKDWQQFIISPDCSFVCGLILWLLFTFLQPILSLLHPLAPVTKLMEHEHECIR